MVHFTRNGNLYDPRHDRMIDKDDYSRWLKAKQESGRELSSLERAVAKRLWEKNENSESAGPSHDEGERPKHYARALQRTLRLARGLGESDRLTLYRFEKSQSNEAIEERKRQIISHMRGIRECLPLDATGYFDAHNDAVDHLNQALLVDPDLALELDGGMEDMPSSVMVTALKAYLEDDEREIHDEIAMLIVDVATEEAERNHSDQKIEKTVESTLGYFLEGDSEKLAKIVRELQNDTPLAVLCAARINEERGIPGLARFNRFFKHIVVKGEAELQPATEGEQHIAEGKLEVDCFRSMENYHNAVGQWIKDDSSDWRDFNDIIQEGFENRTSPVTVAKEIEETLSDGEEYEEETDEERFEP